MSDKELADLAGSVAIITGSSQGIGFATAECLGEQGAAVILNDLPGTELSNACNSLNSRGIRAIAVIADVSSPGDVSLLTETALNEFGRIDIVVNNAGRNVFKPFLDHSWEDWQRLLEVNLSGPYLVCQNVLPVMRAQRHGSIVNISSLAAFGYTDHHAAYAASKAGLIALTRELAYEFGPDGVTVNAVAPGPIDTAMSRSMDPRQRSIVRQSVPVCRLGTPRDVGEAVAFLASPRARFITGATLIVSGGSDIRLSGWEPIDRPSDAVVEITDIKPFS